MNDQSRDPSDLTDEQLDELLNAAREELRESPKTLAGLRRSLARVGDEVGLRGTVPTNSLWGTLSASDKERLIAAGRIAQFGAGTTICRQGDPGTHLFVLIDGLLKVITVTRSGQQTVLALRGAGDVVGELAGELTGYRTASMVALTELRAVVIGHEKFLAFLDESPAAAHAYRRMITQRFSDTADSLYAQSTTNGAQRLAQLLLDLAEKYGEPAGPAQALVLTLPLSQEELASLASASRATVTRALHDWRGRGLIQTGTRRITIADPAALRRLAERH